MKTDCSSLGFDAALRREFPMNPVEHFAREALGRHWRSRIGVVPALVALALVISGCSTAGLTPRNYIMRQAAFVEGALTLDRVEEVLISLGLTVDRRDPVKRELRTAPFMAGVPIVSRIPLGAPGLYDRLRRIAIVRIGNESASGDASVFCRVEMQEQTTQALRMLSQDQRSSDVPDETPIHRDAATSPEQNTVWQTIRRDFAAERAILQQILAATADQSRS